MIQRMASQPKGGTPPPVMTSSPTGTFYTEDRYFGDVYHHLLTSSWPALLLQIAGAFALANAFFALAYLLDGGIANARHGSFADVFFFSVETMATIGYGQMSPVSFISHVLMSIEALTGLISIALITGLIFAKFSRPTARVRFTRVAVISKRDGLPSLMFRMANVRRTRSSKRKFTSCWRGRSSPSRAKRCGAFMTSPCLVIAMRSLNTPGPRFTRLMPKVLFLVRRPSRCSKPVPA